MAHSPEVKDTPGNYRCGSCGAEGVKLWREYQTSTLYLKCARCAASTQNKNIDIDDIDAQGTRSNDRGSRTNTIGWYVPAVPVQDGSGYWGYTSGADEDWKRWEDLPTLPEAAAV